MNSKGEQNAIKLQNCCYILVSRKDEKTYVGYTNDPKRRLKQHNGILSGGARYTTKLLSSDPQEHWEFLCIITSKNEAFNKKIAMSLEWWIKHPQGKKKSAKCFQGPNGRLRGLCAVLESEKFSQLDDISIYVRDDYHSILETYAQKLLILHSNISITSKHDEFINLMTHKKQID